MSRVSDRLIREHAQLDSEAAAVREALDRGPTASLDVFARLSALASSLAEHLLREHAELQAAIARTGAPAQKLSGELEALRWDWEEYLSGWTEAAAINDWELFAEHTASILDRVRRRIATENKVLRS